MAQVASVTSGGQNVALFRGAAVMDEHYLVFADLEPDKADAPFLEKVKVENEAEGLRLLFAWACAEQAWVHEMPMYKALRAKLSPTARSLFTPD